MSKCRVRFAPSPTGALHIGGVRTALYNYLLAKKLGGDFILRIEDTDQTRYVEGAEKYIKESLAWCGLKLDEGPEEGGEFGPYRQSERKEMYATYAEQLVENGFAYYAFDTPEDLDAKRQEEKSKGNHNFRYDSSSRMLMSNSLSMNEADSQAWIESGKPYTIRLLVPKDEEVVVEDEIRGRVTFQTNELDDKVLLKADGMPTYHMANVVDDYLMQITHVVRGEEWLPSTAHHVLLYTFLGWREKMPTFAHLPLILKPTGNGKLSKRDGAKLGIPVFPLAWDGETEEDSFTGFREFGFLPQAVINFLAFLGWNPGTEQEIFSLEELQESFSLDKVSKGGARFDFDKAKWYNQQYIINSDSKALLEYVKPIILSKGYIKSEDYILSCIDLMKERVQLLPDFVNQGYYLFEGVKEYEQKPIRKKWKVENREKFDHLQQMLLDLEPFETERIEACVKEFMEANSLKFGDVLPFLRIGLAGTMKGPGVFEMMALLGKEEVNERLTKAFDHFDEVKTNC